MNEQFGELVNTLATEAPLRRAWLEIIAHRVQCSRLPRLIIRKGDERPTSPTTTSSSPANPSPLLSPEALHHCSYLCSTVPVPRCTAGARGGEGSVGGVGVGCNHIRARVSNEFLRLSDLDIRNNSSSLFSSPKWTEVALRDVSQRSFLHLTSCCFFRGCRWQKIRLLFSSQIRSLSLFCFERLTPEWCLSPVISPRLVIPPLSLYYHAVATLSPHLLMRASSSPPSSSSKQPRGARDEMQQDCSNPN